MKNLVLYGLYTLTTGEPQWSKMGRLTKGPCMCKESMTNRYLRKAFNMEDRDRNKQMEEEGEEEEQQQWQWRKKKRNLLR